MKGEMAKEETERNKNKDKTEANLQMAKLTNMDVGEAERQIGIAAFTAGPLLFRKAQPYLQMCFVKFSCK